MPLEQLGHLGFGIAEIRQDLNPGVVLKLNDLQPDLADLSLRLRDIGDDLSLLAFEAGGGSLAFANAGQLDQPLRHQPLEGLELLVDQLGLLLIRIQLGVQAADFFLELSHALLELVLLALQGRRLRLEELALAAQDLRDLGVVRPSEELRREIGRRGIVALGLEPGPPAHHLVQLSFDDGEVRLGLRIAENEKDVARWTLSPSFTRISLTMPPSRCCTFLV